VFEISDQHILVTGGSSGFGRHFARFLASNGAKITMAARRPDALASAVAEINKSGGKAQSVVLDVTVADKIGNAIEQAEKTFGPIQAVINNAGVSATKPALDQDEGAWDSVVDTNLKGVWLVAQAAARRMIQGFDRQHCLNSWSPRRWCSRTVCYFEGWRRPDDKSACVGMGSLRDPR
jgi:NAD(P)-dependent dehydrogenase (short-subunit alcohol dehydrogenase family)